MSMLTTAFRLAISDIEKGFGPTDVSTTVFNITKKEGMASVGGPEGGAAGAVGGGSETGDGGVGGR